MRFEVAVANAEEIEKTVKAEAGNGLVGFLPDDRLGAVCDAHAREIEHGDVVRSVANGNHLLE